MLITPSIERHARLMKFNAEQGYFDGQNVQSKYFRMCKRLHRETGTLLLFTRDIGYHSSGWFKNPDYERCYHLSLSFHDLKTQSYRPYETDLAEVWVKAFYGDTARFVWEEGWTEEARNTPGLTESRHYRVFCDPAWQPIIPRGEVYTRDFIEHGWKSWSDKRYDKSLQDNS